MHTVSDFAKDWNEPIIDKSKLPVGIGGSVSTVAQHLAAVG